MGNVLTSMKVRVNTSSPLCRLCNILSSSIVWMPLALNSASFFGPTPGMHCKLSALLMRMLFCLGWRGVETCLLALRRTDPAELDNPRAELDPPRWDEQPVDADADGIMSGCSIEVAYAR